MRNRRICNETDWLMSLLLLYVFLKEGSSELGPGGQKDPRAQWGRVWGSDSLPRHQNHPEDLLNTHHWASPLESESMNLRWGSENFPVERVLSQHWWCWTDNHTLEDKSANVFCKHFHFASWKLSAAATQFCSYIRNVATDNMERNEHGCVPTKLYSQK